MYDQRGGAAAWQRNVESYCISEDGSCLRIEHDEAQSLVQLTTSLTSEQLFRSGAVSVSRIGRCAFMTFCDDLVSRDALLTTRILLRSFECHSVDVIIYNVATGSERKCTTSRLAAINAITSRLERCYGCGSRFFSTERPVDTLPSGSALSVLLGLWCLDGGRFDWAFIAPVLQRLSVTRYCRFVAEPGSGEYFVAECGSGLHDTAGWFSRAAGKPLSTLPDLEYAKWTRDCYRQTSIRGLPRFHQITADVAYPGGRIASRDYFRLTIPYESDSDNDCIFVIMSDIDL